MKIRNTFIIFLVSGFWHGANWTFIIWGGLNALYFLPLMITNSNRNNLGIVAEGRILPSIRDAFAIAVTFVLTMFAWIFFRANSVTEAISYIKGIFAMNFAKGFEYLPSDRHTPEFLAIIAGFMIVEWFSREHEHPVVGRFKSVKLLMIIFGIIVLGAFSDVSQFIYFQF